jgi:hypothetical protein
MNGESERFHQMIESLKMQDTSALLLAAVEKGELPRELELAIRRQLSGSPSQDSRPRTEKPIPRQADSGRSQEVQVDPRWSELINAYNRYADGDKEAEAGIYSKGRPTFIGAMNAEERTRRPGIPLELGQSERGEFMLFKASPSDEAGIVLPRTGRAFNRGRFEGGGWSDVYDISNMEVYDRDRSGAFEYRVIKPARMSISGNRTSVFEKGMLELKNK